LTEKHWSKLRPMLTKITKITDLYEFSDFDNLIFFGGGYDGTLRDYKMKPISSLQIISSINLNIFGKINTLELSNELIEKCDKLDWVVKSEIVPLFTSSDDDGEWSFGDGDRYQAGNSVELEVLLSQEDYDEMFKDTESKHFSTECVMWIINKIKNT